MLAVTTLTWHREAMDILLAFCWLATLAGGAAGLIRPHWVKLPSRWAAGALIFASPTFLMAGAEFFPANGAAKSDGATAAYLFLSAGIIALIWWVRKAMRKVPRPQGRNRAAHAEGPENLILSPYERRPPSKEAPFASDDFYSNDMEGEWGRIIRKGEAGKPLLFEYVDAQGEISDRAIHLWVEYPQHFEGWCQDREDIRCFRKERVLQWYEGTNKMLTAPKGKARY